MTYLNAIVTQRDNNLINKYKVAMNIKQQLSILTEWL